MDKTVTFSEKWNAVLDKVRPGLAVVGGILGSVGGWLYRTRKVWLSAPVLVAAIILAVQNLKLLPAEVGLNLLSTGDFSMMVSRGFAVFIPLGITALCLLLVVFSRRTLYPWLISAFTLVLPLLIRLTNYYLR